MPQRERIIHTVGLYRLAAVIQDDQSTMPGLLHPRVFVSPLLHSGQGGVEFGLHREVDRKLYRGRYLIKYRASDTVSYLSGCHHCCCTRNLMILAIP